MPFYGHVSIIVISACSPTSQKKMSPHNKQYSIFILRTFKYLLRRITTRTRAKRQSHCYCSSNEINFILSPKAIDQKYERKSMKVHYMKCFRKRAPMKRLATLDLSQRTVKHFRSYREIQIQTLYLFVISKMMIRSIKFLVEPK